VVHRHRHANRYVCDKMSCHTMNRSDVKLVSRQELKEPEWPSRVPVFIEHCLHDMRRSEEDPVLCDEKTGTNCDEDPVILLREDREYNVTEFGDGTFGGSGGVPATRYLP
jgi:hypothetical protein